MNEHDTVRLVRSVRQGGVLAPPGSRGTIVSVYRDHEQVVAYLIELCDHRPVALLDVLPDDIEPDTPKTPPRRWEWWNHRLRLHIEACRIKKRGVVEWDDLTDAQKTIVTAAEEDGTEIPPEVLADSQALRAWTQARIDEARNVKE